MLWMHLTMIHHSMRSLIILIADLNWQFPLNSEVFTIADDVIAKRDDLDDAIKPLLHNWRFDRIGLCTKLVLRLALWELHNTKTSANIVMNEAIELAKCFAERDAYKFVNGILG